MTDSELQIGVVYPQVLGTYGDTGNALVLAKRARLRGIAVNVEVLGLNEPIPSHLDIYVLGGGEDTAQALAAERLRRDSGLRDAATAGRPILAVCASLQVLGRKYTDATGREVEGLGLIDVVTRPRGARAIGELVAEPLLPGLTDLLTGFENHGGGTTLGPDASPLGLVISGVGNGDSAGPPQYEGAVQDGIIGTYLHGPVLARNPQLADYLLAQAMGIAVDDLADVNMEVVDRLRAERLSAAGVEQGAA